MPGGQLVADSDDSGRAAPGRDREQADSAGRANSLCPRRECPGPIASMVASVRFNSGLSERTPFAALRPAPGESRRHDRRRRKLQRGEDQVDISRAAPADQRERSAGELLQARERLPQFGGTHTSRGVGAISRMVPSISSRMAHCRRSDVSDVFAISIVRSATCSWLRTFVSHHYSTKDNGRATVSSDLRSAATPQVAWPIAAAIIRKAPSA